MLNLLTSIADVNSMIDFIGNIRQYNFDFHFLGENFQSKNGRQTIKQTNYEHLINIFSSFQEEFARILSTAELLLQG